MKRLLILTLVLVYYNSQSRCSYPLVREVMTPLSLAEIAKRRWTEVESRADAKANEPAEQRQARILRKIETVSRTIAEAEGLISMAHFEKIPNLLLSNVTKSRITDLLVWIKEIDKTFGQLQEYAANREGPNAKTMVHFARTVVSQSSSSITTLTKKIHRRIIPMCRLHKYNGLLKLFVNHTNLMEAIIRVSGQSPSQLIYNLYNKLILTQIKGYVMTQFSYILLEAHGKDQFPRKSHLAKQKFTSRTLELEEGVKKIMAKLSSEYWRSDPSEYEKDQNYLEVTKLSQGYLVNEIVLNNYGTCSGMCSAYQETKIVKCFRDQQCRKQSCKSKLYNCHSTRNVDMSVCPATNSIRRYDYIEYADNELLGQKTSCGRDIVKLNAWNGWCPYCICLCDDEGIHSDRYFSLRPAASDVRNNKVVTGLRFVKKNRIIHLQVQQGKLLPHGLVDNKTVEWVPVSYFGIYDRNIYSSKDYMKLNSTHRAVDLHVLQAEERRNEPGYVLTGVRFRQLENHLNFEIRVTHFDFKSGQLTPGYSDIWINRGSKEDLGKMQRMQIPLDNVDVPTKTKAMNRIRSHGNEFVEFTATDIKKDLAQTTVPFIDAQDVAPSVPATLSGAGIYFKDVNGYGGFIGLKVVTYNFSRHLYSKDNHF